MIATAVMNYLLGFITISSCLRHLHITNTDRNTVTLVFCLGDLDAAINSPIGQPYVEVVLNATQSTGATIALTVVMFVLLVSCAVNTVTTSSRQLWSFARDGGPPFSGWLSRVRPGWDV
jgi:choline transport protein